MAREADEILYGFPVELQPIQGKIGINPSFKMELMALESILSISPAVQKSIPLRTPFPRAFTQLPMTAERFSSARRL